MTHLVAIRRRSNGPPVLCPSCRLDSWQRRAHRGLWDNDPPAAPSVHYDCIFSTPQFVVTDSMLYKACEYFLLAAEPPVFFDGS